MMDNKVTLHKISIAEKLFLFTYICFIPIFLALIITSIPNFAQFQVITHKILLIIFIALGYLTLTAFFIEGIIKRDLPGAGVTLLVIAILSFLIYYGLYRRSIQNTFFNPGTCP
ncbi:MAG: hypothetical protein CEN89_377 [Candidatus Berkelbacteria bacterium Licking1014_7]|uniref:Uncharacterized protein n=1 Tax=Candidatus Berkelbacteria bacterium Licking1014_7 TaxID=2017147 RepID=A0A554LJ73_9BACT|nr:MAG: hypothetical protein CEN89_377 [Candidatus Berkelbacteria bacterium Licking1014_7]